MDRKEILVEEWKDIRASLRYFGNKRFAQLTVFLATTGFMFKYVLETQAIKCPVLLAATGAALGIAFFLMERRSVQYWEAFVNRGKEIETEIGDLRIMQTRPERSGIRKLLTGTYATYFIYLLAIVLWIIFAVTKTSCFMRHT
jgi:hypothetical protein